MSKKSELAYAEFFAERLALYFGEGFSAKPENEERSEVDTYIVEDASGKETPLQHKTSHGTMFKNAFENAKRFERDEPFEVFDVDFESWVIDQIEKAERLYGEQAKSLVLVIEGSVPYPHKEDLLHIKNKVDSTFMGIYYVSTHTGAGAASENRFVFTIKKYWDTPDMF